MARPSRLPDIRFVRECLDYNPNTGTFTWRERPLNHFGGLQAWAAWNGRYAGQIAGSRQTTPKGRVNWCLRINRQHWLAQRIAWLLMHGVDPADLDVDHIDRDTLNNRISNLRLASRGQNNVNSGLRKDNTIGVKGVHPNKKGYMARVYFNGVLHHLGTFPTIEEAAEARRVALVRLYGEFAGHE